MKAFIQLFLLITVLQAFHQPAVSAQSAASAPPGPPQLHLEVGKTYCFEYGYRWALPWSISVPGSSEEEDRTYPNEERTWYQFHVTGSEQDSLYRCRVRINRIFRYEQTPFGYDVFDSRYPTSLNTGDARLLADGFTYSGTINAQGRFTPDAISRQRIDSLAARMAVIMSGSFGGCDDYCFLEKIKNLLYRNLGILQLFYPGSSATKWEPASSPGLGAATGSMPVANVSEAYEGVKELEFISRKDDYSLIRLTYDRPEWRGHLNPDTIRVHNENGFVSGYMTASRAMGWEREVFLSFYPQSEAPAILQLELAEGLSFSSHERRRLKRYGIYQQEDPEKVILSIPLERPALFELQDFDRTLFITPGDTLSIKIRADTGLVFAGTHARENRLLERIIEREKTRYHSIDEEWVTRTDVDAYVAELKLEANWQRNNLKAMRPELGPALFNLMFERVPYIPVEQYSGFLHRDWASSQLKPVEDAFPDFQRFMDFIADIPVYNAEFMFSNYGSPYDNFLRRYQNILRFVSRNDRSMASTGFSGYNQTDDLNFVSGYFGGYPWHYLTADALVSIAGTLESRLTNFAPLFDEFLTNCKDSVLEMEVATLYHVKKAIQLGRKFPEVSFTDQNGQPVSINDLRGSKVLLYLVSETDLGPMHFLSDTTPVVSTVMDSLNSLRSRNTDMELVFLYMGAEPDQWQKLVEVAPEGVRLWQVPRDRAETVDFIYGLRRAKGTHQKTWFLIDERQTIFKTGIINSALQKNDKAQHARQVQEFFDREIQLFSLHKASLIDPRLKRWGFLALGVLIPVALLSWLVARWRIRSVRKKEEEKRRVTEIELRAIRAQLNPHFIFNTMSSIQHLVGSGEREKASGYLSDLALLMRMVLKHTERGMISLAEELEAVEKYLSLEQLRFSFQYQIAVLPTVDRHNTLVPAMLLQPYVENAVLHGMNGKGKEGLLQINASQEGNWMTYRIEDNGPGIGHAAADRNGNRMSLKLMREKLRLVYGEDMHLEILDLADAYEKGEGTRVEIRLPVFV